MRVALVFDDEIRPDTTGVYCRRALQAMAETVHFRPSELDRVSADRFDLYFVVDDGLEYELPGQLRPSAFWAIDTHLNPRPRIEKSRGSDFVFAAQKDGAALLRREGVESAEWLPLACDPDIHGRCEAQALFDLCFVGNVFPGPREDLIRLLQERFPKTFVGRRFFEEMAKVYSQSRIVFNRSVKNDVNMRVFEGLCSGSLLVTNAIADNGQEELFQDGVHLATYSDADELLDKVTFYLRKDAARNQIAAAGRAEVLARHTYRHRMERVLEQVERRRPPMKGVAMTAAPPPPRDPGYFEFPRPELLARVPETARRILDVGCGTGLLGASIKQRQSAEVVGIEFDAEAARGAQARLDRVLVGDIESMELDFEPASFDCIVCGDSLEHLAHPDRLLRRLRAWLSPEGTLVASIPNVRHHSVVTGLIDGNWTYEPVGLLDRDHLRFFTRREIEKLFFRAGFAIRDLGAVYTRDVDEWRKGGSNGGLKVGPLSIGPIRPADAEEFFVYQFLVSATVAPERNDGLTSIVIVTYNQLAFTRQCLESIRQRTDEPYELILVDNGSTDGTPEYLASLSDVRLIRNAENRGYPAGANQGIAASQGQQVLLLNNDVIVTTGWLRRMLDCLASDPKVGLVGPSSNNVIGIQKVPAGFRDLCALDGFAWDFGKEHAGRQEDVEFLVGFCLLVRRELIDRVGVLDERFGLGLFDDNDYCFRAIRAGYRLVVAQDAFVHHFGSRTFVGSGVDTEALLQENYRRFQRKWNGGRGEEPASTTQPSSSDRPTFSLRPADEGGLLLEAARPLVSGCMIVRNNARTIEASVRSLLPHVDELIVVDTGSTDETPDICRRLGATVHHFPWCDDFSAARNESLKHARGEWVFWMDSDDMIDAENGRKLRELAARPASPSLLGYVMQVHCPGPDDDWDVTIVDHVKMFRNLPDLRFEGRIHEQILSAIRAAGGEVAWAEVFVRHCGSDQSPEGRQRKLERDFRILEQDLKERPEHPFVLFNLGMTHNDAGNYEQAIDFLRRSIAKSDAGESHLRKAYALLANAYAQSDRHDEAWQALQEGRRRFPRDLELRFREAMLHHHFGRLRQAVDTYLAVLDGHDERHFSSLDRGIASFKARHNLAQVYAEMGAVADAERQWRQALAEAPTYRQAWRGLGELLVREGKLDAARQDADRLLHDPALDRPALRCEGQLLVGAIALAARDAENARRALETAVRAHSRDAEAHRALARFLFEQDDPAQAEGVLRQLVGLVPDDAAAHHNLGVVCLRLGRHEEAAQALSTSLQHRRNYAPTYHHLGEALVQLGRRREAVEVWTRGLDACPGDSSLLEALAGESEGD